MERPDLQRLDADCNDELRDLHDPIPARNSTLQLTRKSESTEVCTFLSALTLFLQFNLIGSFQLYIPLLKGKSALKLILLALGRIVADFLLQGPAALLPLHHR